MPWTRLTPFSRPVKTSWAESSKKLSWRCSSLSRRNAGPHRQGKAAWGCLGLLQWPSQSSVSYDATRRTASARNPWQHKSSCQQWQKWRKTQLNTANMNSCTVSTFFSFHYLTKSRLSKIHIMQQNIKCDVTKPWITKNWSALPNTRALFSVVWDCRVKWTLGNPLRFVI